MSNFFTFYNYKVLIYINVLFWSNPEYHLALELYLLSFLEYIELLL